jgi:hypothetical protein
MTVFAPNFRKVDRRSQFRNHDDQRVEQFNVGLKTVPGSADAKYGLDKAGLA